MATQDIRIEGLGKLLKELNATPAEILDAITPVVERHTKAAEQKALSLVPVKSGLLKRSIASEVKTKPGRWVFGRVAASAPHAHLLEYGTVRASARPFLRPALEAVRSAFKSDAKSALEKLK